MDQATHLLKRAPFDRATAHMLCRVLDEGWAQIRTRYVGTRAEKAGRCNLADGILAYARAGQRDPEALKTYAVTRALRLLGSPAARPKRGAACDVESAFHHHAQPKLGVRDEIQS
jgi:hypothetical protein